METGGTLRRPTSVEPVGHNVSGRRSKSVFVSGWSVRSLPGVRERRICSGVSVVCEICDCMVLWMVKSVM